MNKRKRWDEMNSILNNNEGIKCQKVPTINSTQSIVNKDNKEDSWEFLLINDTISTPFTCIDYYNSFSFIAEKLINDYQLIINNNIFNICELEFYYYGNYHLDSFAHQHPIQLNPYIWYFHRQGTKPEASYKNANYKGLDITFGSCNGKAYAGILIRSIQNIENKEIIEGSCLVVEKILNLCKVDCIHKLVTEKMNNNLHAFNNPQSPLQLKPNSNKIRKQLICSPRVGLTLKKNPSVEREKFLFRPYRFNTPDYLPNKMKLTIILALAKNKIKKLFNNQTDNNTNNNNDNSSKISTLQYAAEICQQTNTQLIRVENWLTQFDIGYNSTKIDLKAPLKSYYGKEFKTNEICKAYAIWVKIYEKQ